MGIGILRNEMQQTTLIDILSSCVLSLFYREEQQFVTYDVLYPLERETRTCENKVKESFIAIFLPESHWMKPSLSLSFHHSLIKKKLSQVV